MATDTTLLQWIESALASHLQEDAPNHDQSYTQQHEADDSSANFISTSTAYLELISSIRSMSDPIEIKQLCTVLIGCLGTIALHSNRFQDLVHALLSVDWIRCHLGVTPKDPSTVASCYVTMLGHLVSQNSCFLNAWTFFFSPSQSRNQGFQKKIKMAFLEKCLNGTNRSC